MNRILIAAGAVAVMLSAVSAQTTNTITTYTVDCTLGYLTETVTVDGQVTATNLYSLALLDTTANDGSSLLDCDNNAVLGSIALTSDALVTDGVLIPTPEEPTQAEPVPEEPTSTPVVVETPSGLTRTTVTDANGTVTKTIATPSGTTVTQQRSVDPATGETTVTTTVTKPDKASAPVEEETETETETETAPAGESNSGNGNGGNGNGRKK